MVCLGGLGRQSTTHPSVATIARQFGEMYEPVGPDLRLAHASMRLISLFSVSLNVFLYLARSSYMRLARSG